MNKGPFSLFCVAVISLLAVSFAYGQKAVITVTDAKTSEPVPYAHVCFEGLKTGAPKYTMTSLEGTVDNIAKEPSKIVISFMGYTTYRDTIKPGESRKVTLQPSVLNINEVVVTAQYTPERADKSIYKIDVINSRQIEQKAATNMADLLKDKPSMQVNQNGVLGSSLRIQGLSGQNVKFLQDGVPLIGRMNGNMDLSQINLNNIDHVEIIEGPMSVIYGSNALAGVINMISKENKGSALSLAANTYWESVGVFNFDLSVSSSLGKNGFILDGGRNFSPGFSPGDTSRSQIIKPRRQYFFDGYYSYTTGKFKLRLGGEYFNELLKDKGALQPVYYITAIDNYFTTLRYTLRGDASLVLPKSHYMTLLASYSSYTRQKQSYLVDLTSLESTPVENADGQDTTVITSWIGRFTYAKNNVKQKLNYQLGLDMDLETGSGKRILGNRQQIGDYAAFLSLKYDPWKVLSIQPGIRFIYNTKYNAPLVYALSAKWNFLPQWNLRFSYAHGFRAPDIKELYLDFQDVNHDVLGNPNLEAEQSNNFNLGVNWSRDERKVAWNLDLSGFYNLIYNVILLAPTGNGIEYTYVNLSRYKTAGGILTADLSLYPSLKLQASVSETGITGQLSEGSPEDPMKWLTELSLSASYRFIKPEITLALYYKYTGKAYQVVFFDESIGWGYVDPYNLMDFTATKGLFENRFRISAGVKNIFDVVTVPATGMGGGHGSGGGGLNLSWGRTFFLRFAFNFNKHK
jgi:outer membrane receptor for ferrienterochelin and colicins